MKAEIEARFSLKAVKTNLRHHTEELGNETSAAFQPVDLIQISPAPLKVKSTSSSLILRYSADKQKLIFSFLEMRKMTFGFQSSQRRFQAAAAVRAEKHQG